MKNYLLRLWNYLFPKNPTVELLKSARTKIKQGWCQRQIYIHSPGHTKYCAIGALVCTIKNDTFTKSSNYTEARTILCKALGEIAPEQTIFTYNDEANRTQKDIIKLYNRAIKLARKVNLS